MEGASNDPTVEELQLRLRTLRAAAAEKRAIKLKAARERQKLLRKQRELKKSREAKIEIPTLECPSSNSKVKKRKSRSPKINAPIKMFKGLRKPERNSWFEREKIRTIKQILIADERQARAERRRLRKEQLNI